MFNVLPLLYFLGDGNSGAEKESCRIPADDEKQKLSLGSRKAAHIQTTLTFTLDNQNQPRF